MKREDEPKTSFITPSGTYCYIWMPEGLKNTGGSFSRMTSKVLSTQIGRNVLTYVDDIIVRSTKQEDLIADLLDTFANFRKEDLKLNPEKHFFEVKKGKFLGCLVSTKGIKANPSKIEAILRMELPKSRKDAQTLAGRLASLNRFTSRSAKRNLPFLEVLKLAKVFQWGPTQQNAFEDLKQYLIHLTTLSPPLPGATLLLYISASHFAVSAALVQEKLEGQMIASTSLFCLKSTKLIQEKLHRGRKRIICSTHGFQEASHYFQSHHIIVPLSQPLKDIIRNREATRIIGKWAADLNDIIIDFVHRSSIQSQALADFIVDWMPGAQDEAQAPDEEV
jgi:hypothetical protein